MHERSWDELGKRLAEAKAFIAPGSRWKHYKGGHYVVTEVALYERTEEVAIVYRSLEHPIAIFVRPLVEWQDMIEHEGIKVYRFQLQGGA